jgi:hypothetical protein
VALFRAVEIRYVLRVFLLLGENQISDVGVEKIIRK